MFLIRMLILEKKVELYERNKVKDAEQLSLEIWSSLGWRLSGTEDLDYIRGAVAIPYYEMLEHIGYYRSHFMDEVDDMLFVQRLSKQYDLPGNLVVQRYQNVARIADSLFGKKVEGLYCDKQTDDKKLRLKKDC